MSQQPILIMCSKGFFEISHDQAVEIIAANKGCEVETAEEILYSKLGQTVAMKGFNLQVTMHSGGVIGIDKQTAATRLTNESFLAEDCRMILPACTMAARKQVSPGVVAQGNSIAI